MEDKPDCPYNCQTAKLTEEIHAAIVGGMDGREGLASRVARHDKILSGINRFIWLAVGALVVASVAVGKALLTK